MSRIAHLSDLHLNGSVGRREKFLTALKRVAASGATHLVLTGDLTAGGEREEFDELAECLRGFDPACVTIVAGNHDLGAEGWEEILGATRLGRFRRTSGPGAVALLGDCFIYAASTQYPRRSALFQALGKLGAEQLEEIETLCGWGLPVIVAMHHGPQWHPLQPFDGLVDRRKVVGLLEKWKNLWILCGHDHRVLDIGRVFTAASVADHADPLRLYDVSGRGVKPVYRSAVEGEYLNLWW